MPHGRFDLASAHHQHLVEWQDGREHPLVCAALMPRPHDGEHASIVTRKLAGRERAGRSGADGRDWRRVQDRDPLTSFPPSNSVTVP